MKVIAALAAAGLFLMAAPASADLVSPEALAAQSDPKATGGVHFTALLHGLPMDADASFTAQGFPDDAQGRVNVRFEDDSLSFTGDVTCYTQMGNFARFSGVMDEPTSQGTHFRISVMDTGEPGDGIPPDTITVIRSSGVSIQDCEMGGPANRPVEDGNLQVHE